MTTLLTDEMEAWARRPTEPRRVTIDRKDIQRFAVATRETDPIHFDPDAARAAGHRDVVAPPMFYVTLRTGVYNLVPQDELHEEGTPLRDLPPIEFSQAMAGATKVSLHTPFVAGDEVVCTRRTLDTYEKVGRSGPLAFVQLEYRYADLEDRPYAIELFTRIYR